MPVAPSFVQFGTHCFARARYTLPFQRLETTCGFNYLRRSLLVPSSKCGENYVIIARQLPRKRRSPECLEYLESSPKRGSTRRLRRFHGEIPPRDFVRAQFCLRDQWLRLQHA